MLEGPEAGVGTIGGEGGLYPGWVAQCECGLRVRDPALHGAGNGSSDSLALRPSQGRTMTKPLLTATRAPPLVMSV